MKKIILLTAFLISSYIFSQGEIQIFNYTSYNLYYNLAGGNSNGNCYPNLEGFNSPTPLPPGQTIIYNGYFNSGLANPPINTWTVYSANGTNTVLNHNSPVLNVYAQNTKWSLIKFWVQDIASGASLGGANVGVSCQGTPNLHVGGAGSNYPFEADWFTVGAVTYFVIQ